MGKMIIFSSFIIFAALHSVNTGVLPTFKIIQDELVVEKNDLSEWLTIESTMSDAGTLDAILNIDVEILKELPPEFRVNLKLERQKPSGEYVSAGINVDQLYCEFIHNDKLLLPIISKFSNFAKECPIQPGKYHVRNVSLKDQQLPLAVPLGNYRSIFKYQIPPNSVVVVWKGRFVKS